MFTTQNTAVAVSESKKIGLEQFDYIQLLVGNAYQAMHLFQSVFGFTPVGYSGLETGARDRTSYALVHGDVRIIVSTPLDPLSKQADDLRSHGDTVSEIAFTVGNAEESFHLALMHGASPLTEPTTTEDEFGTVTIATIGSVGHITHTFVERSEYNGRFLPGFQPVLTDNGSDPMLLSVDHIALSLPTGGLDEATEFYTNVLDMEIVSEENVITSYSAMNSKVVQNTSGSVRFPMMEPAPGRRTSQIEEFLRYHNGPGVQHLAYGCNEIIETTRRFRDEGAQFLKTPEAYYELLSGRVGAIRQDIQALRELGILVDRDEWGHLLQIFSKPITSRPTLFLELIQRDGARGFGSGNIKALFDAVEREQARRGNL